MKHKEYKIPLRSWPCPEFCQTLRPEGISGILRDLINHCNKCVVGRWGVVERYLLTKRRHEFREREQADLVLQARQEVPDWLEEFANESIGTGFSSGGAFGGSDARRVSVSEKQASYQHETRAGNPANFHAVGFRCVRLGGV